MLVETLCFTIGWLMGMATLYFRLKNICGTAVTHGNEKILGDWYRIEKINNPHFERPKKCAKF